MVTGRVARAMAAHVGLALALLAACGGRSISHVEDDTDQGGASGTTTSDAGRSHRAGAASGGTTPRGVGGSGASPNTSKGGTGTTSPGTGSVGSNGGTPTQAQLDDFCTKICTSLQEPRCGAVDYDDCTHHCYGYVALSMHTFECARTLYGYFTCLTELPDACALYEQETCARDAAASLDCVSYYCRGNEEDGNCIEFGY